MHKDYSLLMILLRDRNLVAKADLANAGIMDDVFLEIVFWVTKSLQFPCSTSYALNQRT